MRCDAQALPQEAVAVQPAVAGGKVVLAAFRAAPDARAIDPLEARAGPSREPLSRRPGCQRWTFHVSIIGTDLVSSREFY